jgi:hypothetical protein
MTADKNNAAAFAELIRKSRKRINGPRQTASPSQPGCGYSPGEENAHSL